MVRCQGGSCARAEPGTQRFEAHADVTAATVSSDHLWDGAHSGLAGADFVEQRAMKREDLVGAQREGWIWVSSRSDG